MGQKINPIGFRLGINRTWDSRWYACKNEYGTLLHEDMAIRKELMKQLKQAAVSKIIIERPHKKCRVTIYSARPGVVIGKKGSDIEKLRKSVAKLTASGDVFDCRSDAFYVLDPNPARRRQWANAKLEGKKPSPLYGSKSAEHKDESVTARHETVDIEAARKPRSLRMTFTDPRTLFKDKVRPKE
jgi:hypothetical protein